MLTRSPSTARPGGTMAILLLLLVPLIGMIAFSVDLNYVWRAEAELQTAADDAAQAGATRLMRYAVKAVQPGLTATAQTAIRYEAQQAVAARAVEVGQLHHVGDDDLAVNAADVELGYIADPTASPSTSNGAFQTGSNAPFPNSVRVTVRRDADAAKGPLKLFFGPVAGTPTASRTASATATLRGQNVTGFRPVAGAKNGLMPIALSLQNYQYLTGAVAAPAGVLTDSYSATTGLDGGPPAPGNVSLGGDGCKETALYPDPSAPGNYGLLSLQSGKATNTGTYSNWLLNGPSAADLSDCGANGIQIGTTLYGGPGLKSPLFGDFATLVGQPRICAIVGPPTGSGSNVQYQVVGFTGLMVVNVDQPNKTVRVQLCPIIDQTVTLGGGTGTTTPFVYRGITLSR